MAFSSPPCAQQPAVPTMSETLRWLTGSRAYGIASSDSDTDLRSIVPPDIEDYLTLARPRDRVDQDGSDTVAFGLHHALDIIRTGGPNIIEIFADDAHILGSDELGDMILALKPLVLTTLPLNGLEGYAAGQAAMARRRPDPGGQTAHARDPCHPHDTHLPRDGTIIDGLPTPNAAAIWPSVKAT